MRKVILSLCLCLVYMSAVSAERPRPFEVKRLHSWAPEYLTITNLYTIRHVEASNLKNCPIQEGHLWIDILEQNGPFEISVIIKSIDGQDAKNMSEEAFYNIVNQKDEHEMQVCSAEKGYGYAKPFTVKFKLKDPPAWLSACLSTTQDNFLQGKDIPGFKIDNRTDIKWEKYRKEKAERRRKENTEIYTYFERDFDWFGIQTYDFMPTADPAIDKELLEAFARKFRELTRDTENPDVLIRLTKDEQQSVNSMYVPPTVQVVSNGSTTQRVYNYITKDYSYQTQQNNRVVREGGYVKTTRDENLYLEIVMLDAKRIEEPIPPILYQFKYKRHIVNRDFDLQHEYKNAIIFDITSPQHRNKARHYRITSYEGKHVYAGRKGKRSRDNYSYWYYQVGYTGLGNPQILGESVLQEGDIIEGEVYRNSEYYFSADYRIVMRNGKKIKKKEQCVYKHRPTEWTQDSYMIEDVAACVTFNIRRFAIDE